MRRLSLYFAAFLLIVSPSAHAQADDAREVQARAAAVLVERGAEEAIAVIEASALSDLDKLFLIGQVLQEQGRHAEAVALYDGIIAVRPDLTAFRQSRIRSNIALGNWSAAISDLDILLQNEDDRAERGRLIALRNRLDARRPGGLTFGLNLTPSSNVNRATSNTEAPSLGGLEGTIDETRESGVGLTVSTGGFRRVFFDDGRVLEARVTLSFTGYSESIYNRGAVTGALSYSVPTETARWITRASVSEYRYRDDIDDARRYTLGQSRRWGTQAGRLWEVSVTGLYTDYLDPSRDLYDARGLDFGVAVRQPLAQDAWLTTTAGLAFNWARDDRFSYVGPRLGFELGGRVGESWVLSGGPVLGYRRYDEIFSVLIPERREDVSFGLRASVQNTDLRIRGAVPRLSCLAERTNSNIVFYDNRNILECSVGLSRQF